MTADNIDNEVLSRNNSFGHARGSVGSVKETCFDHYCSRAAGLIFLGIIPREADKESAIHTGNNGYRVKRNSAPVPHGYLCLGRFDNSPLLTALVTGVRSEG